MHLIETKSKEIVPAISTSVLTSNMAAMEYQMKIFQELTDELECPKSCFCVLTLL